MLRKKLPSFYSDSKIMNSLFDTEEKEIQILDSFIREQEDQLFIDSATFKLPDYEKDLGIYYKGFGFGTYNSLETNFVRFDEIENKQWSDLNFYSTLPSKEERRSNIKAKLRGKGTSTIESIKNVVESFTNGKVEIIEDTSNYSVVVKFTDVEGVPPNYEDAKKAVMEVIPAHLNVSFTNAFGLWSKTKSTTWSNLSKYDWESIKGGLYNA